MIVKLIASGSRPWELWLKRWGLSYLVDGDVLFDTFANSRVLFKNFRRFGDDIERVRHIVISHNHWDHMGGLWDIVERVPRLNVHLPAPVNDDVKERIARHGSKVIEGRSAGYKIKEGVYVSGMMMGQYKGKTVVEQALVLEMNRRLLMMSGCGHPGIPNMVKQIKEDFGVPVRAIMGGFHLFQGYTPDQIRDHVDQLKTSGVEMVAPAHCTGADAVRIFQESFAQGCVSLREGQCLMFGTTDS